MQERSSAQATRGAAVIDNPLRPSSWRTQGRGGQDNGACIRMGWRSVGVRIRREWGVSARFLGRSPLGDGPFLRLTALQRGVCGAAASAGRLFYAPTGRLSDDTGRSRRTEAGPSDRRAGPGHSESTSATRIRDWNKIQTLKTQKNPETEHVQIKRGWGTLGNRRILLEKVSMATSATVCDASCPSVPLQYIYKYIYT